MTKREWQRISIWYDDGESVTITRHELEKILSISDVIQALNWAKDLTERLRWMLEGREDQE